MHLYTASDGVDYPSVTTIIHSISNDGLIQWANAMGFKHKSVTKILEETSAFGTLAHSRVQAIIDPTTNAEEPKSIGDRMRIRLLEKNFNSFIEKHNYKTIFTEKSFASAVMQYGGTLDWLVNFDGELTLFDFKTSKKVHNTMLLQLGGYYLLLKENGFNPTKAGIILISDEKTPYVKYINEEELKVYAECFLLIKNFYLKWMTLNK